MITKALKQISHEKTPIANQLNNDSAPLDAPEHEKNMEVFKSKSNDGHPQMLISKQGEKSDNIIRYGTLKPRAKRINKPKNKQIKEPESKNPKRARN